jgi:tricorn protease
VADVIPNAPVDCGENGLNAGDVLLEVDSRKLKPGMDYAEVFSAPPQHKYRLLVQPAEGGRKRLLRVDPLDFDMARMLLRKAEVLETRRRVRKEGNFGYIAVDRMDEQSAGAFADSIVSECYGRDGVIVDVRDNGGGNTADRLLDILICRQHTRTLFRGDVPEGYLVSYWDRPAAPSIPLVVLMNEMTGSNAEAFAHAVRQAKRGVLVGNATPGDVIATTEKPLLDCGRMNVSHAGMFLMDGTDMDRHGAQPDVKVDITPADYANGRDPQLDAALRELKKLAETKAKEKPLAELKYN